MTDKFYNDLDIELASLLDETWFTNLANASALLMEKLEDINWAGFYLAQNEELILGPFQGKPACLRIKFGQGVCGTAALSKKTQLVADVHQFPGHIACDRASESEIVIPMIVKDRVVGVLDIDSPKLNRFVDIDRQGLELIVQTLIAKTTWPKSFL